MLGNVADTLGVLNKVKGHEEQMLFADFDTTDISKVYKDIEQVKEKYNLGHILLFSSYTVDSRDTHYFIISPCYYSPQEIRMILAELKNVDGKFVAVYMRDGINAIRFVPKVRGKNATRFIRLIDFIPNYSANPFNQRFYCRGMLSLLFEYYRTSISNLWDLEEYSVNQDITEKTDLTLREYETIRW